MLAKSSPEVNNYLALLSRSYSLLPGKSIIETSTKPPAEIFFNSSNVIASHSNIPNLLEKLYRNNSIINEKFDINANPIFVYGNQAALDLWELSWEDFLQFASRGTAPVNEQANRNSLLDEVMNKGFIENYSGIRISSTGKKFMITNATVFQVYDLADNNIAQAVIFKDWHYL